MPKHFNMLIIGAGSGGLAAAKQASDYGASVALIENDRIGGTCVNLGCVPKKIMWYAGEFADNYQSSLDYGFKFKQHTFNFAALVNKRDVYINKLHSHYDAELKKRNIHYIHGSATFLDANHLEVNNETFTADDIVIATGCEPSRPQVKGVDWGIDSNGFFSLKKLPKKVVIIGAGYIAAEFSSILNQLGSEVVLLIRHDTLLRHFDSALSDMLLEIMKTQGIQIFPYHTVSEIQKNKNQTFTVQCTNHKLFSDIDAVIFAIGRKPRTSDLNLESTHVAVDNHGFILTDKYARTNIPHIYAIGDVTGKKLLTPVAITAGRYLAKRLFGNEKKLYLDYDFIPTVIFSHPPIGSVGLSEQEAINKYGKDQITIYQSKFFSLIYSLKENKIPSFIKLITLKSNNKIIGCHIVGIGADEMLQGFAAAIKMGATKEDFDHTVAIHPTSAEELVTLK